MRVTDRPKTVPAPASVSLLSLPSTLITGVGRHMTEATFFLSTLNAGPGPGKSKGHTSPASPYCALALGARSERGLLEPRASVIHSLGKLHQHPEPMLRARGDHKPHRPGPPSWKAVLRRPRHWTGPLAGLGIFWGYNIYHFLSSSKDI